MARFRAVTFGSARDNLFRELERMSASKVILSTNIPLRQDGLPYASRNRLPDPGVAVYFLHRGKQRVLACDKWTRIEDNLHAIELTIEAMRGLDRWGCSDMLERAFTGFVALPAPPQWWDVLEIPEHSTLLAAETAYKARIKEAHPDLGGSEGKAASLNWAIAEARKAKGAR